MCRKIFDLLSTYMSKKGKRHSGGKKNSTKLQNKNVENGPLTEEIKAEEAAIISDKSTEEQQSSEPINEGVSSIANGSDILRINVPKKVDKGEDSDPLLCKKNDVFYAVGVFDGMGGSGATEYKTNNGTHTGAYIASRRVMMTCLDYLRKLEVNEVDVEALTTCIKENLDNCIRDYDIKPSGLRSAIIRMLPTTLAITTAKKDNGNLCVKSYWCGDSRNYILTTKGLLQVSTDHLTKAQDPLENLRNDESLSNCICQDKSFTIESRNCGVFTEPIVILSATDGCFGYLKSPMHFEYMLLKTMQESANIEEWKRSIEEWLKPISGDDFSMGIMTIDSNFVYWKSATQSRLEYIEEAFIKPIGSMEDAIEKAKQDVQNAESGLYDGITSLWESYKQYFLFERRDIL